MEGKYLSLYEKHHLNKDDERQGLFKCINEEYSIKKVFYPGSYAHISPAFFFPYIVFNDVYNKLIKFYASDEISEYINKRKIYKTEAIYSYVCAD